MSYRGDSPAKKFARLELWQCKAKTLGPAFYEGTHLALAGPEAGDISVFLGLGLYADQIVAVDKDIHACDAGHWKFPGVRFEYGDVVDVAREYKGELTTAHLDFCGHVSVSSLDKVREVSKTLTTKKNLLSVGFSIGREQVETRARVKFLTEHYETKFRGREQATCVSRTHLITEEMYDRAVGKNSQGLFWQPTHAYYYKSHTFERYGKPMLFVTGKVRPGRHTRHSIAKWLKAVKYRYFDTEPADLAGMALQLDRRTKGRSAHLLLNVERASISAWRAHETRGTYR